MKLLFHTIKFQFKHKAFHLPFASNFPLPSGSLNVNEMFFSAPCALYRYDILSDGLEDVAVDNNMNTQTTLEDEEALDAIDDDSDI
jgi:hypothetical protein